MTAQGQGDTAIAIIGMAGRFPGAPDLEAYWRVIAEGRDTITRFEGGEALAEEAGLAGPREGERFVRARGVLEGVEDFDAAFFDVAPGEAAQLDPQHRLWLEVAWEALEAAGYAHDRHELIVSVYAGSFTNTYLLHNLLPDREAVEEYVRMRRAQSFALLVQSDPTFLPTRTAYKLDLRGPAINVQTACSTSLVAVAQAVQGLLAREADMAVAGGVCVAVPQQSGYFFQEGAIRSRDGACRPYDAAACGTVFGNGAGAVVLKRLADARRDGDPVLAVILGAAVNNDGHGKVSYFAPSVRGQAEVIATAHALAGVEPSTIGYVEGHGTATPMGDPIEVEALKQAFRQEPPLVGSCCLGSAKGNLGHLDAAAGVAGLIRAVLALRHRALPATAHFERPNPELRLEGSPFFVSGRTTPWPAAPHPRRAGVSAFGIGGTNAHVVLEEAPDPGDRTRDERTPEATTLVLSARTPAALEAVTGRLGAWVEAQCAEGKAPRPLSEVAAALQRRRKQFACRRALRVASWADARAALRDPDRWESGRALEGRAKLVMAFPGQGSLRAGALARLLADEPALRAHFDPLARRASELAGFDLLAWALDPGAGEEPVRQDNARAQLAVFCASAALARWLEERGVRADAFAGHSLGEWVGAHLAGVLPAEDALRAVHRRGQLMQASGPGAALVVRLPEAELGPYLVDGVSLACVNGPRLGLLSGRPDAVERCAARLTAAGVASQRAAIDVAVHSPHMDPVAAALRRELPALGWRAPTRPLLSAVTGRWMTSEEAASPEHWAAQARSPVRFAAAAAALLEGEDARCAVVEVGLGDTLTTLVRSLPHDPARHALVALLPFRRGAAGPELQGPRPLQRALDRLWTCGLGGDRVEDATGAEAPTLPTYPFQRQRCWKEAPTPARTRRPALAVIDPRPERLPPRSATHDELRERIVALIGELSGVSAAAVDPVAPFSALGLDSLAVVQLAERLSAALGQAIGFTELSRFNTVAGLAARLRERLETRPPGALARQDPPSAGFRGLFPIRQGDGTMPLLLVHGDVGNDLLPPWLPPEQPIYGYAHQGSDGERIELRTVEALAARCHAEWTAAGLAGPCVVAGHSYGGLVAHQVAHLMRGAGQRVELLVLIDTEHPRVFGNAHPPGLRRLRRGLRRALDWAGFVRDVARGQLALALRGRVPAARRTAYIMGVYDLAGRRHAPPALDVDALIFRASESGWPSGSWPTCGWDAGDFRRLEVRTVPGDHLSIVREEGSFRPVAAELARRLRALRGQSSAA